MKARWLKLLVLPLLLVSLMPAGTAFADNDSGFKFYGNIGSLPSTPGWIGDWTVSGRTVHVAAATFIQPEHGPVQVGACVEVKGWLQSDGSVNAVKIETKQPYKCGSAGDGGYIKFYGIIESLPNTPGWIGDWVVSGRTVHVAASTFIKQKRGPVRVGAYVEVKGIQQADGTVNATKIEVKR